jgi:enamine deaminase RidA (YjgF/YER057c/UK114 family)
VPDGRKDEIAQAFLNVERTLATAGASSKDVMHVNPITLEVSPVVNETMSYRQYMPDHAPIWTQLGAAALGLPALRIEI